MNIKETKSDFQLSLLQSYNYILYFALRLVKDELYSTWKNYFSLNIPSTHLDILFLKFVELLLKSM